MIQVALVGCAHIHTPGFAKRMQERSDVNVKTVWDHDEARAQRWSAELNAARVAEPSSIWSDDTLDAV
ncbi:MAG: gfo/Idh/MocA family oxidoreductase, partial [Caldilineaceae bacterium]|nr:gfo/Idh/MocA family oxidoreductase [Caldilineaceae bacterium]